MSPGDAGPSHPLAKQASWQNTREYHWTPLCIEDPDPIGDKKLLHRLINVPLSSPHTRSGTVSK